MPTGIEWTDETWNPVVGCSVLSPGCTNCYAMKMAARIERMDAALGHAPHYRGLTRSTKAGPVWTGQLRRASDEVLSQPMRWRRPRRIFVNSMSDLFHESVSDRWIDAVFAIMAMSPQHVFQVLTKRADRMRRYMEPFDQRRADSLGERVMHLGYDGPMELLQWPLPNVWLGVSVEDQARADERIPHLLATPAAKRFISAEPLLGPVDLRAVCTGHYFIDALAGRKYHDSPEPSPTEACAKLDWIIVGGESGKDARPVHPDWVRSLRDQCAAISAAFFFKQWGEWLGCTMDDPSDGSGWVIYPDDESIDLGGSKFKTMKAHGKEFFRMGKKRAGATLDGVEHRAMP